MFKRGILRERDGAPVKLLSADADILFDQQIIRSPGFSECPLDDSLIATSRALIYPRLRDDEVFYVGYAMTKIAAPPWYYVTEDTNNPSSELHIVETNLESADFFSNTELGEWTKIEKITDFYKKSFKTVCYTHKETRRTVIYVEESRQLPLQERLRRFHYLQCSIVAALPWIFSPNEGITELEMQVIKGLTERTETSYITALNQIAEQYNFKDSKIRRLLGNFEQVRNKARLEVLERDIEKYAEDINRLNEQVQLCISSRNTLSIERMGLMCAMENQKDEEGQIAEYFKCNKALVLLDVKDDTITFGVKTYLEYYDEDNVRAILNNPGSYVYERTSESDEDIRMLLKAIFIEQRLRLRVCAVYKLSLSGIVKGETSNFDEPEYRNTAGELVYMPNAHIQVYHCLGTYSVPINKCISAGDYIGAIEQCVASAQSLNFTDPSAEIFMEALGGENPRQVRGCVFSNKCIELPDGNVVRPKEAIKYLKESAENEQIN